MVEACDAAAESNRRTRSCLGPSICCNELLRFVKHANARTCCDWLSPNTNHCPRICGIVFAMTELNYCVLLKLIPGNPRDRVCSLFRQKFGLRYLSGYVQSSKEC